ncbi:MAG: YtxH domain-containing protein [Anaeromyxobacteraceae bacterium]
MAMSWKAMKAMWDRDELLRRVGLEERTPTGDFFTGLGLFSVGVLVGAGLGLLFAPRRGDEMRQMVGDRLRRGQRMAQDFERDLGAEAGIAGNPGTP